jgi:hypothetical protein
MLEVHNLRHKLCLARTAMSKNCLVLNALKADAAPGQSSNDGSSATSVSHMAGQFKLELDSMLTRGDNLMIRLDGASTLVGSDGTEFEIRANLLRSRAFSITMPQKQPKLATTKRAKWPSSPRATIASC